MRIAIACQTLLRIEYPLAVDENRQETLDYFMPSKTGLVVVAKRDDLTRGFTQLAMEMVALAKLNPELTILYRAVAIGELWVLGTLQVIVADLRCFVSKQIVVSKNTKH